MVVVPWNPVSVTSEAAAVDATQPEVEPLGTVRATLEWRGHADNFKFITTADAQDRVWIWLR